MSKITSHFFILTFFFQTNFKKFPCQNVKMSKKTSHYITQVLGLKQAQIDKKKFFWGFLFNAYI
jgi:hypothetical protein